MCTTGHNSYQGCQYCDLRGIWENHVYFPMKPPKGKTGVTYNPNNLLKRTHQDYLKKILKWKSAENNKDRERIETTTRMYCEKLSGYIIKYIYTNKSKLN